MRMKAITTVLATGLLLATTAIRVAAAPKEQLSEIFGRAFFERDLGTRDFSIPSGFGKLGYSTPGNATVYGFRELTVIVYAGKDGPPFAMSIRSQEAFDKRTVSRIEQAAKSLFGNDPTRTLLAEDKRSAYVISASNSRIEPLE